MIDRSLVETRDGAERTGDQMQLVLNDQLGLGMTTIGGENGTGLGHPRQTGEFVHRADDQTRPFGVNLIIHHGGGNAGMEIA